MEKLIKFLKSLKNTKSHWETINADIIKDIDGQLECYKAADFLSEEYIWEYKDKKPEGFESYHISYDKETGLSAYDPDNFIDTFVII